MNCTRPASYTQQAAKFIPAYSVLKIGLVEIKAEKDFLSQNQRYTTRIAFQTTIFKILKNFFVFFNNHKFEKFRSLCMNF